MPVDPLDSLRLPDLPLIPRPQFANQLRAAMATALDIPPQTIQEVTAMSDSVTTGAAVPYICVHDGAAALVWYANALGAVETLRYADDTGKLGHAEFMIGTERFMLSDEFPEMGVVSPRTLGGTPFAIYLQVADVDYTYNRSVERGATGLRPPADQEYGERGGTMVDPFGHRWMLTQPLTAERSEGTPAPDPKWQITGRKPVELGYFTIPTRDPEVAAQFYNAVLGWRTQQGGDGTVVNTHIPFTLTSVEMAGEHPKLWFKIDAAEPYIELVEANGGRVVKRTEYPSGEELDCVDDQGFTFLLHRAAPGY